MGSDAEVVLRTTQVPRPACTQHEHRGPQAAARWPSELRPGSQNCCRCRFKSGPATSNGRWVDRGRVAL